MQKNAKQSANSARTTAMGTKIAAASLGSHEILEHFVYLIPLAAPILLIPLVEELEAAASNEDDAEASVNNVVELGNKVDVASAPEVEDMGTEELEVEEVNVPDAETCVIDGLSPVLLALPEL